MIRERCSCGSKFESDSVEAIKLWREWRRKHPCTERQDLIDQANTSAETKIETIAIGFAPNWHPGRQDPGLDE
jgi:hypothetical protein